MDWFLYDNGLHHERVITHRFLTVKDKETFLFSCYQIIIIIIIIIVNGTTYNELSHIEPMFRFGTPWKHQKTLKFSGKPKRVQYGLIYAQLFVAGK